MISLMRWLTFVAYLSLLLIYFKGGASIFNDIQESIKSTGSYLSTVLMLLMLVDGLFLLAGLLLICLGRAATYEWAETWWLVGLGTILTIISIATVYWFRFAYLRGNWSGSVKIQSEQEITDQGPYRIVRHPLYAMSLVMYPSIALTYAAWWIWLACGLMILGYMLVTYYEDKSLAINLPGYREYQQRTRYRLLPGIW